jgi:hypothetical protein
MQRYRARRRPRSSVRVSTEASAPPCEAPGATRNTRSRACEDSRAGSSRDVRCPRSRDLGRAVQTSPGDSGEAHRGNANAFPTELHVGDVRATTVQRGWCGRNTSAQAPITVPHPMRRHPASARSDLVPMRKGPNAVRSNALTRSARSSALAQAGTSIIPVVSTTYTRRGTL